MQRIIVVALLLYAIGMAIGQLLFKIAADEATSQPRGRQFLAALLHSWQFYAATLLYALLTVIWVWILGRTPLSRAYPFVVLAFVITPALAHFFLGEALDAWYFTSLALILAGLALLVAKRV